MDPVPETPTTAAESRESSVVIALVKASGRGPGAPSTMTSFHHWLMSSPATVTRSTGSTLMSGA